MKAFDQEVKPNFTNDPAKSWFIAFPKAKLEDDPANNLEADFLHLKCDAVNQIFEPVVNAIEKLVAEQVDKVRVKRMTGNHPKGKEIKVSNFDGTTQVSWLTRLGDLSGWWIRRQPVFQSTPGKSKSRHPSHPAT